MRLYRAPYSTNVERVALALAPPLYPDDPARRAELDASVECFDGVWKVAPNAIEAELGRGDAADAGRIAQLGASMARALDRFEALLSGRSYVFGDAFSAADCCVFPFVRYAARRDPDDRELFHRVLEEHQRLGDDHPRLADWIARVDALPRV